MNLILLFPEDFTRPTQVRLTDYRADHIRDILRVETGKVLRVGLVNGGIGAGRVVSATQDAVDLAVQIPETKPEAPDISLIVALPRPQTLKKVLETAASFGLRRLDLIHTARVQKSFFSSKLLEEKSWLRHVRFGLEQGGKTCFPKLDIHPSWNQFIKEDLKQNPTQESTKIILDPEASATLWESPLAKTHDRHEILCAVGPEGGWMENEIKTFVDVGFQPVRLGTPILRVENAVCAFLSQIQLLQARFLRQAALNFKV